MDIPRPSLLTIGTKVIVTTDSWFYGPNGQQYRAVYGTVLGVYSDEATLGIRTNARSSNWYAQIGGMVIAGCQIHYVCAATNPPPATAIEWTTDASGIHFCDRPSVVLDADDLVVLHPHPASLLAASEGRA